MSHVFHRDPRQAYPTAIRGEGVYIFDSEGKRYLDAMGGAAVSCLGHSDPEVVGAIKAQLDRLPFAHTAFFSSEPMEQLAEALAREAPAGVDKVYFVSGGSEAIEAALKLARQYFVETGQPSRRRFIARRQSYHGNTLGALAVGGNQWRRRPYAPLLIETSHIAPCYAYRGRHDGESEADYGERVADELESEIQRLGPETVIAFVAETVVGATLGAVPPVAGYFRRIREICNRHGVLLILDEVMCGMGRTGSLYACAEEGVVPDMIAIAKGMGAGFQPIGALMVHRRVYDAVVGGSGFFQHGHTYMGHAAAAAGALAVQRAVRERGLLARVRQRGAQLDQRLRARFGNHPHVGDIRGRGLFFGVELVADRLTKQPFDPALKLHARIKRQAMAEGLICYPMGGTLDGVQGDHVLLAPPFVVEENHLDEAVDKLGRALTAAMTEIRAAA